MNVENLTNASGQSDAEKNNANKDQVLPVRFEERIRANFELSMSRTQNLFSYSTK